MREGLDATPDLVARQKDEARLLGLLAHDGIVQVLDLAEVEGRPAVVMEYVEGVDLADLIKSTSPRRIPIRVALEIVAGVASALDAAFNSTSAVTGQPLRVIHRDIKPANMLLTIHGRVKVLDFGVAKADFARDGHTTNGGWGTPRFMSPEQWLGEPYGAPVDVYALGVTLFDLVADRPWERPPLARTAFEHHIGTLLDTQRDVPEAVLGLVAAMTSFDAADRPTAAEVRERCESIVAEVGGDSLARFSRVEVPPLVEARSRSNANKPLPGAVSLGGVSATNGGGRAEPTHEPSAPEPSIAAPVPEPAPAPLRPLIAGALVIGLLGLTVVAIGLGGAAWKLAGGFGSGDAAVEAPVAAPAVEPAPVEPLAPPDVDPALVGPVGTGEESEEVVPPADPEPPGGGKEKVRPLKQPAQTAPPLEVAKTVPPPPEPVAEAPKPAAVTWPFDITTDAIGAAVWVDDKPIGNTPVVDYPLPAGMHIVVVAAGAGRSAPRAVNVGPDGPAGLKYYPSEAKWRTTK